MRMSPDDTGWMMLSAMEMSRHCLIVHTEVGGSITVVEEKEQEYSASVSERLKLGLQYGTLPRRAVPYGVLPRR